MAFIWKFSHVSLNELLQTLRHSRASHSCLFHYYLSFLISLYVLYLTLDHYTLTMAKCPGCKKDINVDYLGYHRSKCKKSNDALQKSLEIHSERRTKLKFKNFFTSLSRPKKRKIEDSTSRPTSIANETGNTVKN